MSLIVNPHRFPAPSGGGGGSAPTYVGASTVLKTWQGDTDASISGTVDFSSSGRASGDMLVIAADTLNYAVSVPSGFTAFTSSPEGTGTQVGNFRNHASRLSLFYKISDGTETTITVTGAGAHLLAVGFVLRGVDQTTPIDVEAGDEAADWVNPHNSPAVTTTGADRLVVVAASRTYSYSSVVNSVVNSNLSSLTTRLDEQIPPDTLDIQRAGLLVVTGEKASAGSTGVTAITYDDTEKGGFITFAVKA